LARAQADAEDLQTKLSEATTTNEGLIKYQEESDMLRQQLAEAKMNNVELEAELDAIKNQKPDTSAADALKKELDEAKKQYLSEIESLRAEKKQLLEEKQLAILDHEAIVRNHADNLKNTIDDAAENARELSRLQNELHERQAYLHKLEEEIASIKRDNDISAKEFQAHKDETTAKVQRYEADYNDMYESMTAMVMEEQNKREVLEKSLRSSEEQLKEAEKIRSRFDELNAQLKVKDAEIAEAKVSSS
jgi:DNA repair exonuclease SbcCD ATPase subunit